MMGMGAMEVLIIWAATLFGGFGVPFGLVPGEEDPYLSQIAPEECFFYTSWSGTEAADPAGNATEKWIAQKQIQDFWKKLDGEIDRQIGRGVVEVLGNEENERPNGNQQLGELRPLAFRVFKLAYKQPCAFFVDRANVEGVAGNLVMKLGEVEEEVVADLNEITDEVLAKRGWSRQDQHDMDVIVVEAGEAKLKIGVHKGYLLIAFAMKLEPSFDTIFANEKTPEPKWLTAIKNDLPVKRRSSIGMVDVGRIVKTMKEVEGEFDDDFDRVSEGYFPPVSEIRKIGFVTGLDDDSFVSRTSIQTEGELGSVLSVFDGAPLDADQLGKIPADRDLVAVSRLDSEKIYEFIEEAARSVGDKEEFEEAVAGFDGFAGMTLKEDLLSKLEDYAFIYTDFTFNGGGTDLVLGVGIKDEMAFLDTIDAFSGRIEEVLQENDDLDFSTEDAGGTTVYGVAAVGNMRGFGMPTEVFFAQHQKQLLIGTSFESLKKHIALCNKPDGGGQDFLNNQPNVKELFAFGESIGCEGPIGVFTMDTTKIFETIWPMATLFRPQTEDFKLPVLPGADVMTNGLSDNFSGIYRTDNGFQLYQKSVVPSGSPASGLTLMPLLFFGMQF